MQPEVPLPPKEGDPPPFTVPPPPPCTEGPGPRWDGRTLLLLCVALLASFLAAVPLTVPLVPLVAPGRQEAVGKLVAGGIIFPILALGAFRFVLRKRDMDPIGIFGLSFKGGSRLLIPAIVIALGMSAGCMLLKFGIEFVLQMMGTKGEVQDPVEGLVHLRRTMDSEGFVVVLPELFLMGVAICVLVPVVEEVMFRGVMFTAMKQYWGRWPALLCSSVCFGLLHLNLSAFLPITLLGMVLSLSYERTRNLAAPILIHAFFNLANTGMLFALPLFALPIDQPDL